MIEIILGFVAIGGIMAGKLVGSQETLLVVTVAITVLVLTWSRRQ